MCVDACVRGCMRARMHTRTDAHFALVGLLEPLAKPDQAALLQWGQVAQVSLDVVCI